MRCGKQLSDETWEYCFDCAHKRFHYTKGFPLWQYDGKLRNSIVAFKYKGRRNYAGYYARELAKEFGEELEKLGVDLLVPVPVHPARLRKRGYNQAAILSENLSKELGIVSESDTLLRVKKTMPQKELSDAQRLKNLSQAFVVNPVVLNDLAGLRVVLVDDIYTTGSTIESCSRVLLEAGVEKVYYLSLGIGRGC